jgi:hypothetical protein
MKLTVVCNKNAKKLQNSLNTVVTTTVPRYISLTANNFAECLCKLDIRKFHHWMAIPKCCLMVEAKDQITNGRNMFLTCLLHNSYSTVKL